MKIETIVQDSEAWHAWRKSGIGASEIASILGLCPYGGTPYKVWQVKTGRARGFEGNSFTEHGKALEAKARALYELINMEDMPPACGRHPVYTYLLSSFDGFNQEVRRGLELKCPVKPELLEKALKGEVAENYRPQCQQQMLVGGLDLHDFFVYHDATQRYANVEVKPDLELQARIVIEGGKFWNDYVLTDTPPPLMDSDAKDCSDNEVIKTLCERLLSGKDSLSKKQIDGAKERIIALAEHPKMECGRVLISTVNRNGKFSYHKLTIRPEAAS